MKQEKVRRFKSVDQKSLHFYTELEWNSITVSCPVCWKLWIYIFFYLPEYEEKLEGSVNYCINNNVNSLFKYVFIRTHSVPVRLLCILTLIHTVGLVTVKVRCRNIRGGVLFETVHDLCKCWWFIYAKFVSCVNSTPIKNVFCVTFLHLFLNLLLNLL